MVLIVVLGGHEDPQAPIMVHITDHHTITTGPALAHLVVAV